MINVWTNGLDLDANSSTLQQTNGPDLDPNSLKLIPTNGPYQDQEKTDTDMEQWY